jgi:hypothetical protein
MSKSIRLLCAAALLAIVQGAALAHDSACKFAEWGFGHVKVEQQSETSTSDIWTYVLTASGPNWRNRPYGYHAPGQLVCEDCASGKSWHGLYHFHTAELASQPATAAERAAQRKEWFGYPSVALGSEHLDHAGSREGIALGALSGYAVLYRLVAREGGKTFADLLAGKERGLLVVHLTDGCVFFDTTVLLQSVGGHDPGRDLWAPLDSLLKEVTIAKFQGARPAASPPRGSGYSTIVRPTR